MSIGLIGKPIRTRLITGSVHYGDQPREARNAEWQDRYGFGRNGRKFLVVGVKGTYTMNKRQRRSR